MNRKITTLHSLAGQTSTASTAAGPAHDAPTPETLAATLRQLARIIHQSRAAAPLPSGTSVDWPLPEALSATARLDRDDDDAVVGSSSAFRGHGRVLGPMLNAAEPGSTGTAADRHSRRFASASSLDVRRGSVADTEAEAETTDADWKDDGGSDEADDKDQLPSRRPKTGKKTGTVVRDETQSDGTREIEVRLGRSRGSVTLLIPRSPALEQPAASDLPADAAAGKHAAGGQETLPEISFQLSPGFQLQGLADQARVPEPEPESKPKPEPFAAEFETTLDRPRALDFLDSGFYEGGFDDGKADSEARAEASAHDYHDHGHGQPSVDRRLQQVLAYLQSQDPTTDRHWHAHAAAIETYLDFLEAGACPGQEEDVLSPPPPPSALHPPVLAGDAAQLAAQQQRLNEALARAEADEALARAEMEGRESVGVLHLDNIDKKLRRRPPAVLGARTRALLDEARQRLQAHRVFLGCAGDEDENKNPRARILDSVDSVPSYDALALGGSELLQQLLLLASTGRPFAGRMALDAQVEEDLRSEDHEDTACHDTGKGSPTPPPDTEGKEEKNDYLFDSLHNLFAGMPLERLETRPFTRHMARFRRLRQHYMEEARVEVADGDVNFLMLLPPNDGVFSLGYSPVDTRNSNGSPRLVPRAPLPAAMERDRRLLGLLRALGRLLLRRLDTAPRPLLADVLQYVEQGLGGLPAPQGGLRLRDGIDYDSTHDQDSPSRLRPLCEAEARWLQFLLSDSTNERLAAPLPDGPFLDEDPSITTSSAAAAQQKSDEEGRLALYYAFAHRFQALLDDISPDSLFPTADGFVPATAVVDAVNRRGAGGPSFSVYDGLHFLARLSRAGRCRFHHFPADTATHGAVQRPLLTIHPEQRIQVRTRDNNTDDNDDDDAIGAPRRAEVDASWAPAVARGTSAPVPADVRRFFCCLAFRFGHSLRALETEARPRWKAFLEGGGGGGGDSSKKVRAALRTWAQTYRRLLEARGVRDEAYAADIPTSFVDVVRLADPALFAQLKGGPDPLTEEDARRIVWRRVMAEAAAGQDAPLVGEEAGGLWDWAQPAIVGEAPSHYFHMDRWPLHLQTRATAANIQQRAIEEALDPELLWDPASEDPTPATYLWHVGTEDRRYGFRRLERADTEYRRGETALQRRVIERDLTRRVAAALGMEGGEVGGGGGGGGGSKDRGVLGWFGSLLGKRKRGEDEVGEQGDEEEEDDDDDVIDFEMTELPDVAAVPASVDWTGFVAGQQDGLAGAGPERSAKAAEAWTDEDDRAVLQQIYEGLGV